MKNKVIYIHNLISVILLAVALCLLTVVGSASSTTVYAAPSPEVLQDLRKDKDFDESAYPYKKDDHGLYVIQIAESANKELFIYAYQPCHDTYDLVGTKVSISYGYSVDGSGLTPKPYILDLISTSGTLDKYHVVGFTVPNDGDRYYNIVEIFRMVNSEIDEVDPAFPKTDIAYPVGQQWYVCDLNDSKHYEMNTFNTLPVETVFNGSVIFLNGIKWENFVGAYDNCDCWFYCFNVEDYVVNHIYDADLTYSICPASKKDGIGGSNEIHYDYDNAEVGKVITLNDSSVMTHNGGGLQARTFKWNRILSSNDFLKTVEEQNVKISDSQREKIKSSQWVFTYLETERKLQQGVGSTQTLFSNVYGVGVLRLHFQDVNGKKYDLGVVNDLTDPDDISDGLGDTKSFEETFAEFWDKFVKAIFLILGVILLIVLLKFVPLVKDIFKFIFKGIAFVVTAPFKLLKSIFKKDG